MRVCERDQKPAGALFKNQVTDEEFDLCKECYTDFQKWMGRQAKFKTIEKEEQKKKGFFRR